VLYVIGQIYTSTTHASADFFALQSSVTSDATDSRAYARLGLKSPLEHDILQNFITCAKEINNFRILFAC